MNPEDTPPPSRRFREEMVHSQLAGRDITDPKVLEAMARTPRHLFANFPSLNEAYGDDPYPISCGQTISQPYMVAFMTQELDLHPDHRVLEIGTGSGYQTALLAILAKTVYTMERHPHLSEQAQDRLRQLGFGNIQFGLGDGTRGWPEEAPFDRILITAAAAQFPHELLAQLKPDGGIMILPMDTQPERQELFRLTTRMNQPPKKESLGPVRFVPLIPDAGP